MARNKKYYLNVIFMAVLLAAVFYVLLKDQDLNDILNAMNGAKKFDMVLSMLACTCLCDNGGIFPADNTLFSRFQKTGIKVYQIFIYRVFL